MGADTSTPKPPRIAALPVDGRGFPIPWNLLYGKDGKPLFTVNDHIKHDRAIKENLCPVCGQANEEIRWFYGGPMSVFHPHGVFLDLPGHLECIEYAMAVCPYLASRNYRHRADIFDPAQLPDGVKTVDYTQMPQRPIVFCLVGATDIAVIPQSRQHQYVKPAGKIVELRYWDKGIRLSQADGEELVKQAFANL